MRSPEDLEGLRTRSYDEEPSAPLHPPSSGAPDRRERVGAERSSPLRVLRNRNFAWLWMGSFASGTGSMVAIVVFDWYMYSGSGRTLLLTTLGIVEFLPSLTLGLLAGALADRYDRRRLMIGADVLRAVALAGTAAYVVLWGFNALVVLLTVFTTSALGTLFSPSSDALLPGLVEKRDLHEANGLLTAGSTVAQLLGSPLGGALLVLAGVASGLLLNSATYAFSALCVALLSIPLAKAARSAKAPEDRGVRAVLRETLDGLRYVRSQSALFLLTLGGMVLNLFSFYNLYIVIYAANELHAGASAPAVYGALLGASAVGAAIGGLLVGRWGLVSRPGLTVPLLWGAEGVPLVLLALWPWVPLAFADMFALGFLGATVNVTFLSVVQRTVPDRYLGRYLATAQTTSNAMIPAGIVLGGLLIVLWGVGWSFVVAGAGILVVGLGMLGSASIRSWGLTAELANRT